MRKNSLIFITSLISILLLNGLVPIQGASKIIIDETQDVYHRVDGVIIETDIDRYPEIDIESIEINVTSIVLNFVGTPNMSWVHHYDFSIWWNGKDINNITNGIWDDLHIGIATQLYDELEQEIAKSQEFDTVELIGTSLVFPLLNGTLISNLLDPREVEVTTRFIGFESGYDGSFRDILEYKSKGLPGNTAIIAVLGISTIALIIYIKRRK